MTFGDEIEIEHLLFFDRKCRVCGQIKNLIEDYYLTRKDRNTVFWEYPDW